MVGNHIRTQNDIINACLQFIYKGCDSDSSLEGN